MLPVVLHSALIYRTHAGILDAAASITSVLSACFPHLLDKLPRERAFFPGPQPLLLGSLDSMDDLSILLSSDPGTCRSSQPALGARRSRRPGGWRLHGSLSAQRNSSLRVAWQVDDDECVLCGACDPLQATVQWSGVRTRLFWFGTLTHGRACQPSSSTPMRSS